MAKWQEQRDAGPSLNTVRAIYADGAKLVGACVQAPEARDEDTV